MAVPSHAEDGPDDQQQYRRVRDPETGRILPPRGVETA